MHVNDNGFVAKVQRIYVCQKLISRLEPLLKKRNHDRNKPINQLSTA